MATPDLDKQAQALDSWAQKQKANLDIVEKRVGGYITDINRMQSEIRRIEDELKNAREEITGIFHGYRDKIQEAVGRSVDIQKELSRLEALQRDAADAKTRGDSERAAELSARLAKEHGALEPVFASMNGALGEAKTLSDAIRKAGERVAALKPALGAGSRGRKARAAKSVSQTASSGWSFRKPR